MDDRSLGSGQVDTRQCPRQDLNKKGKHTYYWFASSDNETGRIQFKINVACWRKGLHLTKVRPTFLWDLAEGHAIPKETGGEIYILNQHPLVYNMNQIRNQDLIAVRDKKLKFNVEEKNEA